MNISMPLFSVLFPTKTEPVVITENKNNSALVVFKFVERGRLDLL
jgi:hypothetical protein